MKKPKICGIATKSMMIKSFMLGNLQYVNEHGYESCCLCASDSTMTADVLGGVKYIPVNIKWGMVSPFDLIKEVWHLYKIFKREEFDIIQYAASNASLSAAIAGWIARVPVRINLQWGLSYPIYKGRTRAIRKIAAKIVCKLSTSNQPDSFSNQQFMIKEGLCSEKNSCVIYNGSACGVNMSRFDISQKRHWREQVLKEYGIDANKKILGFVGRIVKEKGINELLHAFLKMETKDCILMLVGPIDENCRIEADLLSKAKEQENIIFVGPVSNPEKFFSAFDFMLLPSYQEGFGMTTLEAAALGVPAIVTNIKGPTDVVTDGVNGLICEVKSVESLMSTMDKALTMSIDDYSKMSNTAYKIVKRDFDSEDFKLKFLENRNQLLASSKK